MQTTFFLGFMCGNFLFGVVADKHGRRSTMLWCSAAMVLLTLLSAWPAIVPRGTGVRIAAAAAVEPAAATPSTNGGAGGGGSSNAGFWVHLVLRSLTGTVAAGQALAGYVIATEMVGPAWRGAAGEGPRGWGGRGGRAACGKGGRGYATTRVVAMGWRF